MSEVRSLVASPADRGRPRTEAMVQTDVRRLLIEAPLGLDEDQVVALKAPVEGRRCIDVEVGYSVIDVKKDWVLEVAGDGSFVRIIARRLGRFGLAPSDPQAPRGFTDRPADRRTCEQPADSRLTTMNERRSGPIQGQTNA